MRTADHLFMVRPHLEGISAPELPAGFSLRACRAGDGAAWLDLVSRSYGGAWPEDAFHRFMLSEESFRPERLFFIVAESAGARPSTAARGALSEAGGRCVATAAALQKLFHGDRTGYVHMMAVAPEYRRRGLGAALLRRCLLYFREQGWRDAALDTEASRLEAIRLYLAHGFAPAPEIEADLPRWRAALTALGRPDLAENLGISPKGLRQS